MKHAILFLSLACAALGCSTAPTPSPIHPPMANKCAVPDAGFVAALAAAQERERGRRAKAVQ